MPSGYKVDENDNIVSSRLPLPDNWADGRRWPNGNTVWREFVPATPPAYNKYESYLEETLTVTSTTVDQVWNVVAKQASDYQSIRLEYKKTAAIKALFQYLNANHPAFAAKVDQMNAVPDSATIEADLQAIIDSI